MGTDRRSAQTVSLAMGVVYAAGRVLVLKRRRGEGEHPGCWAGISSPVARGGSFTPAALRELAEQAGLDPSRCSPGRQAPTFHIEDATAGRTWNIQPLLLLTSPPGRRRPTGENPRSVRWVAPEMLPKLRTVPRFPEVVEAVLGDGACAVTARQRNRLDQVLLDGHADSLALAERAAALVARAPEGGRVPPATIASLLSFGRPARFGVANACEEILQLRASGREVAVTRVAAKLAQMRERAARRAAEGLRGRGIVVTIGASASVEAALHWWMASPGAVEVRLFESRPPGEGAALAARLARFGPIRTLLYPDAAMGEALRGADTVLLGAEAVFRDGSLAGRTGSLPLALCARALRVPVWGIAEPIHASRSEEQERRWLIEEGPAGEFRPSLPRDSQAVERENPAIERVPAGLLSGIWGMESSGA